MARLLPHAGTLILDFSASTTVKNNFLYKWYSVIATKIRLRQKIGTGGLIM
jgi:hypothetical protein